MPRRAGNIDSRGRRYYLGVGAKTEMPVAFEKLWSSFPTDNEPCRDGKGDIPKSIENQCAVRLSVCFRSAGITLKSFSGARCWYGHGHFLRAEETAKWLATRTTDFGKPEKKKKPLTATDYAGRQGLMLCLNFWGRGNNGDHIDLWDGTRFASTNATTDYIDRSPEVWFWELGRYMEASG